ncbi:hypothetical protein HYW46_07160 [Candidatus Daviesbacteria bacterium]|nr:hypothetical protein [Candidatus Daviesbacteria bacterium]
MSSNQDKKSGSNYDAWKISRHSPSSFQKLTPVGQMEYLCACGHLAPSSHNTQPWKFQPMSDQTIRVYLDLGRYYEDKGKIIDQRRVLPVSDKNGHQGCVSIGCAIANIEAAARFLGVFKETVILSPAVKIVLPLKNPVPTDNSLIPVANIKLSSTKSDSDKKLFEAIFTRRVNRDEYNLSKKIPSTVLQKLRTIKTPGVSVHLLERDTKSAPKLMLIANSQFQADKTVFNNDQFISELGRWVLKNDSDKGLGMPFGTFGVKNSLEAVKLYLNFKLRKAFSIKDKSGFSQGAMKGIESAPLVGIITVKQDIPKFWIEAGRLLGKIALTAEASGFAMAIHAGIAEVEGIKQSLSWINHAEDFVVILFRLGYSTRTQPHAPRLPIAQVML